jgi:hypothetical protein
MRNLARSPSAKARARAAAGAALLDRVVPGWWRRVRIRPLDISDDCNCVTGQLFGTYTKGLEELELATAEAKDYGFDKQGGESYWTLTDAWRNELRARRYGRPVGRQS